MYNIDFRSNHYRDAGKRFVKKKNFLLEKALRKIS